MQNFFALPFLFLLCGGCDSPEPSKPIELTFHQLSESEKERFIADSLFQPFKENNFLKMRIQNNAYDSLYMALFQYGKHLLYRPCGFKAYRTERDSLIMVNSSNPIFCRIDTAVCLLKNQSANFIFAGRCSDQKTAYEYNFSFYADSAGQGKYPQFMQFPCGVGLPKKQM